MVYPFVLTVAAFAIFIRICFVRNRHKPLHSGNYTRPLTCRTNINLSARVHGPLYLYLRERLMTYNSSCKPCGMNPANAFGA